MAFASGELDHTKAIPERAWTITLCAFVILAIALGGTSEPMPVPAFLLRVSSILVITAGLIRIGFAPPNRAAREAFVIILLSIGLILLHLIPLPPIVWGSLPGRNFVMEQLRAAGSEPGWMALSLSPPATRIAFLAMLAPIAAFIAALSLSANERWLVAIVLLICVLASILLGLAQKFQGPRSILNFYGDGGGEWATGTFANRNFFAALLYCAIPVTWALALRVMRRHVNKYLVGAFASVMLLAVILGLAAAGSRAGIILAMLALLGSAAIGLGATGLNRRNSQSRWAIMAAIAALLLIGQFGMVAILRLAELDPVSDYRTQISETTLRAAWDYFPVGSGFGTFVPVYAMHETPASILSAYVNHAHNDWLELWLEGGLPAALVMLAFLAWYLVNLYRLWRPREDAEGLLLARAGAIACGLLLLHSLVDYPLREPALAVVFGLMCAFIAGVSAHRKAAQGRKP
ncbi:MAG: O-antigen ligase family protein [Rhizobiales bacterium]|nr:O-antigen ligase family protein [Hyphomicrobiales bacterium]